MYNKITFKTLVYKILFVHFCLNKFYIQKIYSTFILLKKKIIRTK